MTKGSFNQEEEEEEILYDFILFFTGIINITYLIYLTKCDMLKKRECYKLDVATIWP